MSVKSMPFDLPPWDSTAAPTEGRAYLKLAGNIFLAGTKHAVPELAEYFEYSTRDMPGMGAAPKVQMESMADQKKILEARLAAATAQVDASKGTEKAPSPQKKRRSTRGGGGDSAGTGGGWGVGRRSQWGKTPGRKRWRS